MLGERARFVRVWLVLLGLWAFGTGVPAAEESDPVGRPPSRLTLDDALELARAFNPEVEASRWQVLAAGGRELQADKVPNPELDLRFSQLGERGGEEEVARRRIVLRQDLELGGKRARRVDLARVETQLADWDQRATEGEVALEVQRRFAEVLGAQQRVALNADLVTYIEKLRAVAQRMVETGSLRRMEMELIVRRLGLARIDLLRAEADLESGRLDLAALWGGASPEFETAVGDLELGPPLPGLEAVLERVETHPTAERWETEVERGRAELDLARAGAVPDLNFGLGVAWEEGSRPPDYLLDLEIDIPLFDRNQGNIQFARSELQRARVLQEAAEASDARLLSELYYELRESAARSAILAEEVVPSARAAVTAYRLGFEGQAEGPADLLDSRRDLARTEIDLTEALVDYKKRLAELERLIGQPLPREN
jgi:cobalt-zinc-cadmium efflux system outer membrane protein